VNLIGMSRLPGDANIEPRGSRRRQCGETA